MGRATGLRQMAIMTFYMGYYATPRFGATR
jgi:hypothetical protein